MPQSLAASDKPTQFKSSSQTQIHSSVEIINSYIIFKFVSSLTNSFMCKIEVSTAFFQ
jgi:hypothetical protein